MKKFILFCLILASVGIKHVISQDNPKAEMEFTPEVKTYVFAKNSSLKVGPWDNGYLPFVFEKGTNWVFKYHFKSKDYKMVADDEYTETLTFEIPPQKANSFSVKGDLRKYKFVYSPNCFCKDAGAREVKSGLMRGRRIGKDKWEISLVLMVPQRDGKGAVTEKRFKGVFILGELNND
ncbi:MAG: hypothetical protein ACOVP1_01795 [Bacteroidia bacterium]